MDDIREDMRDFIHELTRLFKVFETRLDRIIKSEEEKK